MCGRDVKDCHLGGDDDVYEPTGCAGVVVRCDVWALERAGLRLEGYPR